MNRLWGVIVSCGMALGPMAPLHASVVETPAKAVSFNIPAQQLRDALSAFGRQAGLFIAFYDEAVADLKSSGLTGSFTPEAALTKLLANSGLKYEFVNAGTVSIKSAKRGNRETAADVTDSLRLAASGAPPATGTAPGGRQDDTQQVTVEGKRDAKVPFDKGNLDLTRTEDDTLPYTVFSAEDIALSGSVDVAEFLRERLPQNLSDDNAVQFDLTGGSETTTQRNGVDMRGWGAQETVFLLNGRRMPPQYGAFFGDSSNSTPSLRGIPLGSIERIEILSSAGSAIYGANATGGVINIITKREFQGGQLTVGYETPADVSAPKRDVNFNYGLPLAWGMGLRFNASYSDSAALYARDRQEDTILRWRRLALQRDPARLPTNLYGSTPNIASVPIPPTPGPANPTPNLFAGVPGAPASHLTSVPIGYTGGGGRAAFTPGSRNAEIIQGDAGGTLYGTDSRLIVPTETLALSLGLDKNFGEHWRWSLDASYSEPSSSISSFNAAVKMFSNTNLLGLTPVVPGTASINPFGQDVRVWLVDPNLIPPELTSESETQMWSVSTTLHGEIGRWRGYLDFSHGKNSVDVTQNSYTEPLGGWRAAFLSGAYNPFVDSRAVAPATPSFYQSYIYQAGSSRSDSNTQEASLKASGPMWDLPAGEVQMTAGLSWSRTERDTAILEGQYINSVTGLPQALASGGMVQPSASPANLFTQTSYAFYAEATVPLLSSAQNIPFVERLELFGSERADRQSRDGFSTAGASVPYETATGIHALGLRYDIVKGVALRVSQTVGIRPPAVTQVTESALPTQTLTNLLDRRRRDPNGGDEPIPQLLPTMYLTGGNPELKPESVESINAGIILTPRWIPGFRLSLDYLESVREDSITSVGVQGALDLELEVPRLVVRGAPDGDPSGVGPVLFVDGRNLNLREVSSKSLDISLDQQIADVGGGRVSFTVMATKNLSFKVQNTNTGSPQEQVRNPTITTWSRQIKWNGNAQLRWQGPSWGIGWSAKYYDSLLLNPASAFVLMQGGTSAPWKLTHDVNFNYRTPDAGNAGGVRGFLDGTSLTVGIKNVFDRKPRFWASDTDRGVAPFDGSNMRRSLWVRVTKDFN